MIKITHLQTQNFIKARKLLHGSRMLRVARAQHRVGSGVVRIKSMCEL